MGKVPGKVIGSRDLRARWWSVSAWRPAVALLMVTLVLAVFAAQGSKPKKILVLYSFSDPNIYSSADALESAIRSQVRWPVDFYVENLDAQRFDNAGYEISYAETLRATYEAERLDVVLVAGASGLNFAAKHRDQIFPGVPIVFFNVDRKRIPSELAWPGVTGVTEDVDVPGTISLALHLHPRTNTVAVITNNSGFEKYWLGWVHTELLRHGDQVREVDLVGLATDELFEKVSALPPETVILFQQSTQGSIQPAMSPYDTLRRIGERLPTYCIFPILCLDHGGIGGADTDTGKQVSLTAQLTARVLNGERPESIPVVNDMSSVVHLDWRQLRHWNIAESALPAGSVVLYREPTVWEQYWKYIVATIVVIGVQFLLILGLLWQRARKRKAEGRLESIVRSAMNAIIAIDNEQRIMLFNTAAEKMFGYHASEVIGGSSERLIPHRFRAQYSTYIRRFGETSVTNRDICTMRELCGLRTTGEEFPIEASISHLESGGRKVFTVIIRDVTEHKQAEEARFRHAAIVESSDDAIISKTLDGIIVSWNVGAKQIFGYTEAEAVGQPITILIPTELRDEEYKILERIRAGERIEHYETIRVTKAGNKVNVSLTISPIKDTTGRVVGASKIARDITERKRAEEALRASEERFRLAAQAGKMFAYEWDLATDVIVRSGEAGRTLGIDEGLVTTGQQVLAQVHPEDRERVMAAVAALGPEKPHLQISFRMVRTDGTIIRVERSSRAHFDERGRMLRVVGMVADVTERKRAEEQLHESEERFRLVATTAPVMIWMSGRDKRCTYFNQPWLTFTGRSIHQELGNGWAEGVHSEDLERCLETYKQAFDRREPFDMEYRLRRHDGEYRWIFDCGVPRFNADGSFAGYIGSASDMTDQKLAREALEKVSGQLLEAQEKERSRLARELHDGICQRLATLSLRIEKATKGWGSGQSSVGDQLDQIWQQCSTLAGDVQALSHELHPSILYNLGLATAVKSFCREVSEQSGVVVKFAVRNLPDSVPREVSLSVFRVVQEAVHNAIKYSGEKH